MQVFWDNTQLQLFLFIEIISNFLCVYLCSLLKNLVMLCFQMFSVLKRVCFMPTTAQKNWKSVHENGIYLKIKMSFILTLWKPSCCTVPFGTDTILYIYVLSHAVCTIIFNGWDSVSLHLNTQQGGESWSYWSGLTPLPPCTTKVTEIDPVHYCGLWGNTTHTHI